MTANELIDGPEKSGEGFSASRWGGAEHMALFYNMGPGFGLYGSGLSELLVKPVFYKWMKAVGNGGA